MTEAAAASFPGGDPADVRPLVRTGSGGNVGMWVFLAILLVGGILLFTALNSRRQDVAAPSTLPQGSGAGMITAPPELSLPAMFPDPRFTDPRLRFPLVRAPVARSPAAARPVVERIVERPAQLSPDDIASILAQRGAPEPVPAAVYVPPPTVPSAPLQAGERVTAGRLANPSLTVPKGTIVAAVLETALDSSRPGAVRAIVSRDVRSFDGSRVLIPRGSRLYGEYNSDVTGGQKRALITWQRLTRPDAVVVNLDSPAADPLGRAGVEGKVNSHFFARFGGAILQSVLDIGVGLATRSVVGDDDTVILGLPGSTQQVTNQIQQQTQVQPTLRVRQGTSVSVFVARDLDFSTVDG
jgi:type IV secretion system protein VirB10